MFQLIHDETKNEIYQIDPSGKKTTITNDFPSKPEFSSDGKKAIYISPLEWECPGSLYLYNLENGYITEIVGPDKDQNIPKYAKWINENIIALIIGFGWGTVNVGGNVYTYDVNNSTLQKVTNYSSEIQITELSILEDHLKLKGIKYIDDNFSKFIQYEDQMIISKL
ncbi:DUF4652 domain-containing protein [Cytobacillus sp. FSL W7-1323]|uniref:DUF4652 domain-containing protein n=1 Tax=Cytobacillus sp. FSL W7-1323 TaxID=2921700 RepID=UPI0031584A56